MHGYVDDLKRIKFCRVAVDITQPGPQHIRGAEQPGVPGGEDHEGGPGLVEMREVRGLPARPGLLRGGECDNCC